MYAWLNVIIDLGLFQHLLLHIFSFIKFFCHRKKKQEQKMQRHYQMMGWWNVKLNKHHDRIEVPFLWSYIPRNEYLPGKVIHINPIKTLRCYFYYFCFQTFESQAFFTLFYCVMQQFWKSVRFIDILCIFFFSSLQEHQLF